MTGRELYERECDYAALIDPHTEWTPWEDLSPMRQAGWNLTAAEYVSKRLDDEAPDRMTDEGGPAPREDEHGS